MLEKKKNIEASIHLFAQKGYHQTTIQEIADYLGIAKGSVYSYFSSKEDLFLSTFQYYHQLSVDRMFEISSNTHLSPKKRMQKHIQEMLEMFKGNRDFIVMQMKEQPPQNKVEIHTFIEKMRADFE